MSKLVTFEDSIDIINEEIYKRRSKWTLTAIQWMDYSDVAQLIRVHINKKWEQWDQARPIRPWLHAIIINQIHNILRNLYLSKARPCLSCAAAEDTNLCTIYGTQCTNCPLYANWVKTKKSAHDVHLPVALEFHYNEISDMPENSVDVERAIGSLHEKMKRTLRPIEYKVYKFLYVDGGDEEGVAQLLGFKTTEKGRQAGYRQLKNIKDSIMEKAKKLVYSGEIDFI